MPSYKKIYTTTKPHIYPTWDVDLQTWLNAHNAPLLDNQKEAIHDFIVGLKADGIWGRIDAFYILRSVLPNDFTNYWKYNLKNPSEYQLSFYCNNATVDRIRKQPHSTQDYISYAKTGYVFSSSQRDNKHLMIYTDPMVEVYPIVAQDYYGYDIGQETFANGVIDAIGTRHKINPDDYNKFRIFLSDNNNSNVSYDASGFHCVSRLNSTEVSAVRNNVVVMDNVASISVDADNGQEILIGYANGEVGYYNSSFASIGPGMTKDEMLLYNSRIDTLSESFYNMEVDGDYYHSAPIFSSATMKEYSNANVEIKLCEAFGIPLHLLAQRGDIKIGFPAFNPNDYTNTGNDFYISTDCGETWVRKRWIYDNLHYASAARFMHIFENGTIIFSTKYNKLWKTTDYFDTITEITLQNADGSPYVYHTPVNAAYPGSYFKRSTISSPLYIDNNEVVLWGNWGNNTPEPLGASPINIYFSDGNTVKVIYTFGQYWRDDGTATGSATSGNLLGDALNPIAVYHVHSVSQNPNDGSFWVTTGEEGANARWMRGVYDTLLDEWTWTSMAQGDVAGPNVRALDLWWKNGFMYFGSDAYQSGYTGIYKIAEEFIGQSIINNGSLIHPVAPDSGTAMVWGDEIINVVFGISSDRAREIHYSKNGGESWFVFTPYVVDSSIRVRNWLYKDTNGYFSFSTYSGTILWLTSPSYLIKFNV